MNETDLSKRLEKAYEEIARLRGALEDIGEYWNRDENHRAMADACWHTVEVVESALKEEAL